MYKQIPQDKRGAEISLKFAKKAVDHEHAVRARRLKEKTKTAFRLLLELESRVKGNMATRPRRASLRLIEELRREINKLAGV